MKEDDKKGLTSTPQTTETESIQPIRTDEQAKTENQSTTDSNEGDYVVVGSGLGIDE